MSVVPVCMEGFYTSGMTCLLCDRGSFNNQLNQTTCDSCPGNQTTMAMGSTLQDHCGILFDFYNKSRLGFYHLVRDHLFQGRVAHHRLKVRSHWGRQRQWQLYFPSGGVSGDGNGKM